MSLYSGKKLLILAGKPIGSIDIIEYAREEGAYTIVTDNLPTKKSSAKILADEHWDESTASVDLICDKISQHKIDAVFTGVHEFNLWKTLEICENLSLPFYASRYQMEETSIKSRYKQLFREHDVPVIDEFKLTNENFEEDVLKLIYPVLIKPVDGSGGYGISICYNEFELRKGYDKALEYSKCQKVLVEKYIDNKEVTIFYIVQNGNIMLSSMADRHTENGSKYTIPLPVLYTFPSNHLSKYQEVLNKKVISAFQSIGLRNGMIFIQAFVNEEGFKLYDIGFRLTGTQEYHILEELCNYNPLKMMVDYSFTKKMGKEDISHLVDPLFGGKSACNITFLVKPCVIDKFVGIEEVEAMKGVIKVIKNHQVGDEVSASAIGTLNQVAIRVLAVAENKESLKKMILDVTDKIDIYSTEGKSVVLQTFNMDEL